MIPFITTFWFFIHLQKRLANNTQNPRNLKDTFDILGGYNFLIRGDGFFTLSRRFS